jgi:hypothetical protein
MAAAIGTDLDGQAWANPPSIGCDEVVSADFSGPLGVGLTSAFAEVATGGRLPLTGLVSVRAAALEWAFGDGSIATNLSFNTAHVWTPRGRLCSGGI